MICSCLALSLLLLGADERGSPGYPAYQRANSLFVAQKFAECQAALDEALRLDPKLAPAFTLRAKLALATDDFPTAQKNLERAIASDPSNAYAHFLYGLQFFMQNDLQRAVPPLEKARQLNKRDPRAPLYLGLTAESLGKTEEATALYSEAIRLEQFSGQPQVATLLISARLLLLTGRMNEGAALIGKALKIDPNSRDARFEFARLLLVQGDASAAAQQAETALRLSGGEISDTQIRYLLVRACQASGQDAEAAKHAAVLRSGSPPQK